MGTGDQDPCERLRSLLVRLAAISVGAAEAFERGDDVVGAALVEHTQCLLRGWPLDRPGPGQPSLLDEAQVLDDEFAMRFLQVAHDAPAGFQLACLVGVEGIDPAVVARFRERDVVALREQARHWAAGEPFSSQKGI